MEPTPLNVSKKSPVPLSQPGNQNRSQLRIFPRNKEDAKRIFLDNYPATHRSDIFLLVYWRKKILWFNISVTSVNCKHVSQGSCYIFLKTSVKSELSWWTGALLDRPNTTLHLHCTSVQNNTHLGYLPSSILP